MTVNWSAQTAAYNALKAQGKQAGVVALNTLTGAVWRCSYPSFDPNQLAALNGAELKRRRRLLTDPDHRC